MRVIAAQCEGLRRNYATYCLGFVRWVPLLAIHCMKCHRKGVGRVDPWICQIRAEGTLYSNLRAIDVVKGEQHDVVVAENVIVDRVVHLTLFFDLVTPHDSKNGRKGDQLQQATFWTRPGGTYTCQWSAWILR
jgi:hypothetical protein